MNVKWDPMIAMTTQHVRITMAAICVLVTMDIKETVPTVMVSSNFPISNKVKYLVWLLVQEMISFIIQMDIFFNFPVYEFIYSLFLFNFSYNSSKYHLLLFKK